MNKNLLIVGAGQSGLIARDIAEEMGCFEKIGFADDAITKLPDGTEIDGTVKDIPRLNQAYGNIIVAIGKPDVRLELLKNIEETTLYKIVSLISPRAYVAKSAQVMKGCIIEPMAVVNTGCVIAEGCILSAGSVVNHCSMCCSGVHVDCNATVAGSTLVPPGTKVESGTIFDRKIIRSNI